MTAEFKPEEIYILILDNALEEAKKREARMRRNISAQMTEHRQLCVDIQSMEEKIANARDHFLSAVPIDEVV